MEFIQWNYVLPHCKLMPSLWIELVPLLIAGIIGWDIPVHKLYPLLLIVIIYLCPPLSLHYCVFRVGAINPINCLLVLLPLQVIILSNICILMFGDHHWFFLLKATATMYSLSIILPSIAGFILCITSRMCLLYLSNLPLWLKISFLEKLKNFILTMMVNLSNLDLSLLLVVLAILLLQHILPNRIASLNAAIDILSTLVWLSYIMLRLLQLTRLVP